MKHGENNGNEYLFSVFFRDFTVTSVTSVLGLEAAGKVLSELKI